MDKPGPTPSVTGEDVRELLEDREDEREPVTAPEIAERLGVSRRTALNVLHDMEDAGTLASKKVGGRARVWWLPAERE